MPDPVTRPTVQVDVLYRSRADREPSLYARMPTLPMAIQQYNAAVRQATTNPRCPYVMVCIKGHEDDYFWVRGRP